MPNPLNFGSDIVSLTAERMFRPSPADEAIMMTGEKTNVFGTNMDDNVELWFYNPDGTYAGNLRLSPQDDSLSLSTVLDSTGAYEILNLDMTKVISAARLPPGRYSMAVYFYRDEVGSLNGERLLINAISNSRTEVRLTPAQPSSTLLSDVYEFVVPSVPKLYAKALLDEIFAKSLNFAPDWTESLNALEIGNALNTEGLPNTTTKIARAQAVDSYTALIDIVRDRTYTLALQNLTDYVQLDSNIQYAELETIVKQSLRAVLNDMVSKKEIDPRFTLVPNDAVSIGVIQVTFPPLVAQTTSGGFLAI